MRNLRYCMQTSASECIKKHPQNTMKELGIDYMYAVPQSNFGIHCWHFWGCSNVPDKLPLYLSEINALPIDYIGWGLSKDDALNLMSIEGDDE